MEDKHLSYSAEMLKALSAQKLKQAQQKFEQALKYDDDQTLFSLAEELQALGFDQQSEQIANRLLQQYPDADDVRLILAEIAINQGKTDRAQTLLDQIKPSSPVYPQSLLTAADFYQTLNLLEVSEQKLLTAKKLLPKEPAVLFALGELYLSMGRFREASHYYQVLLDQKVEDFAQVSIEQRLAEALAGDGDYEGAAQHYEHLTRNIATDDQLFHLGVLYQNLKQPEKAVKTLLRLQEQHADYSALYRPLVESQLQLGRNEAALKSAQTGLGYDDYNLDLYRLGAQAALRLDNLTKAKTLLQTGLKIDPTATTLTLMLAELLLQQDDAAGSIHLLAPLAEKDDVDPQVDWLLGRAYQQNDQLDDTRTAFFQAYPNYQRDPQFMRDFIHFLQTTAMKKELKSALHQYLHLVPDDPEFVQLLLDLEADDH